MEINGNGDNEKIARLEMDNRALREQLSTACSKLERIQITLRSLSESMLNHVTHGSASHVQSPEETLPSAASNKEDEDVTAGNNTMMPTRSESETASETITNPIHQCDDEISRLQSNMDGEQLSPSIFFDALPTAENLGTEQNSSLDPSFQGRQTSLGLDVSYLGSLLDVRSLPGTWTHEYQMGPANFQAQNPSASKIIRGLANSNSSFSDHMQMIRGCLKMQWCKATQIRTDIETP